MFGGTKRKQGQPSKDPMIPCLVMYLRFDHGKDQKSSKKIQIPSHSHTSICHNIRISTTNMIAIKPKRANKQNTNKTAMITKSTKAILLLSLFKLVQANDSCEQKTLNMPSISSYTLLGACESAQDIQPIATQFMGGMYLIIILHSCFCFVLFQVFMFLIHMFVRRVFEIGAAGRSCPCKYVLNTVLYCIEFIHNLLLISINK